MNQQILRLAASHFPRDGEGNIQATPETIAEFAELIVRECAHLVGGYVKEDEFGTDVKEAYEEITKHFGVEQ